MSHTHLTPGERFAIEQLRLMRLSFREIGRRLGRHHSTIAREVRRNIPPHGGAIYIGERGERLALERRRCPRHRKRFGHAPLRIYVWQAIRAGWSPEQVSGRLRIDHPRSRSMRIGVETIYGWIYRDASEGGTLYRRLRRRRKRRRRRHLHGTGRGLMRDRVSIRDRPARVAARRHFGDWEGDLMLGKQGAGSLLTVVERKSRYLLATKLTCRKAPSVAAAICALIDPFPNRMRRTLTLDNGKEFAAHGTVRTQTGLAVYFADPYAAWQRGAIENANGLIRQYIPKGSDIDKLSDEWVALAINTLNHRPRKCLGFRTPEEVITQRLGGAIGM